MTDPTVPPSSDDLDPDDAPPDTWPEIAWRARRGDYNVIPAMKKALEEIDAAEGEPRLRLELAERYELLAKLLQGTWNRRGARDALARAARSYETLLDLPEAIPHRGRAQTEQRRKDRLARPLLLDEMEGNASRLESRRRHLASLYARAADLTTAPSEREKKRRFAEAAVAIYDSMPDAWHEDLGDELSILSSALAALGDKGESLRFAKRAVQTGRAVAEKAARDPHPIRTLDDFLGYSPVAVLEESYAVRLEEAGAFGEAIECRLGILEDLRKRLHPGDERIFNAILKLGETLDRMGDHAGRRDLLLEMLQELDTLRKRGIETPGSAEFGAHVGLAVAEKNLGREIQSVRYAFQAREIAMKRMPFDSEFMRRLEELNRLSGRRR